MISPLSTPLNSGEGAKCEPPEPSPVKEFQRKQLLERVNREGATIGSTIPDEIAVQGETLDLQEFVFEIKRRDTVPAGERERVDQAKRNLRRERIERLELIEENEVSYEEGEELVESIIGIDRALNALEQLQPVDLEQESKVQEAADKKRWMTFLNKALGRDSDRKGIRR
ncbi:hypothetical protein SAMN04487950_2020 [Halogranum rubrum]|uniref:Uncharacterized protein n=1 Tax=Halogranum rubrum TaxID=553466 RepID=A0A1I4EB83_9EURY|nr:hypothetical protein SAMN04487950_2020 [Halogranum rubrum]